jgi:hypothetical protein
MRRAPKSVKNQASSPTSRTSEKTNADYFRKSHHLAEFSHEFRPTKKHRQAIAITTAFAASSIAVTISKICCGFIVVSIIPPSIRFCRRQPQKGQAALQNRIIWFG